MSLDATPSAPHDPTTREQPPVSRAWIAALGLGVFAVFASLFGPLQILLPAQADAIAAEAAIGRESLLALITSTGAAAAMVANPVWGLVSDRCRVRFGSRTPVVIAGALLGAAGQVVLFSADTTTGTVVGWVIVQTGLNGPFAVLAALISDQAPERQRGLVGSLFGVGQIVGVIGGTAVATLAGGERFGYLILAAAAPALFAAIVLAQRSRENAVGDAPGIAGAAALSTGPVSGLAAFRPTVPFAWAWSLRFAMNLANAVLLLYLYYYLDEIIGVDDVEGGVLMLTVVTLVLSAIGAAALGAVSDRVGRRKPMALAGAVGTGAGFVLLAFAGSLPMAILAAAVLGMSWGAYISVDMAIVTSTLASNTSSGTMLGVANIASSLPQVVAPAVAAPIVTLGGGYPALYLTTAVLGVVAAVLVLPIRTVR